MDGKAPLGCQLWLSDLLPNYGPSLDNCLPVLCLAATAKGRRGLESPSFLYYSSAEACEANSHGNA